jgi:hypothetical protein
VLIDDGIAVKTETACPLERKRLLAPTNAISMPFIFSL